MAATPAANIIETKRRKQENDGRQALSALFFTAGLSLPLIGAPVIIAAVPLAVSADLGVAAIRAHLRGHDTPRSAAPEVTSLTGVLLGMLSPDPK